MWNLDDSTNFLPVLTLTVPWAHTYANMQPGKTDRERRERIRSAAASQIRLIPRNVKWWAFRISVRKKGRRPFDIENVPKPIIDAFCKQQITKDNSTFRSLGLYLDDSLDNVRVLQVTGERVNEEDSTTIEIFAFIA